MQTNFCAKQVQTVQRIRNDIRIKVKNNNLYVFLTHRL